MAFEHLSCHTLKLWLDKSENIELIDIRDPQSYAAEHIPGAKHIGNHNVASFLKDADPQRPLVVCCYHGNSSQGAADYFNQQGIEQCYSLDGGFESWRQIDN